MRALCHMQDIFQNKIITKKVHMLVKTDRSRISDAHGPSSALCRDWIHYGEDFTNE